MNSDNIYSNNNRQLGKVFGPFKKPLIIIS